MLRVLVFSSLVALLLAASVQNTRSAFCSACYRIIDGIEEGVESHEPNILKHCENICDDVLGHIGNLGQECKDWLDKDFAEIMDKLQNDWTPEKICKSYHLC